MTLPSSNLLFSAAPELRTLLEQGDISPTEHDCPNCGAIGMLSFYRVEKVPVHSVLLMQTQAQAVEYPRGDIELACCPLCGFVSNVAFDPKLHDYSAKYESTQSYSPTFNSFHRRLAQRLIDRYDLHDKTIVEIGCGQGEFLVLLTELADNRGIGVDPAYDGRVKETLNRPNLEFVADFYSEKYVDWQADFVCCKMTLEHIPATADFVRTVRRSIGPRLDTTVFFQIPNGGYVLQELAFWDVYYEHCSYFSQSSLRFLFENGGFAVLDLAVEYDDQYLMIETQPVTGTFVSAAADVDLLATAGRQIAHFARGVHGQLSCWRDRLARFQEQGKRVVIWGSGSKGVAFLTTLGVGDAVGYAVDINPNKHGTFMAGSGHEIVGPEFLRHYRPDVVIVMNPIYRDEIQADLDRMELTVDLMTV